MFTKKELEKRGKYMDRIVGNTDDIVTRIWNTESKETWNFLF